MNALQHHELRGRAARLALAVCPVSRQPGTGIPSRVLARLALAVCPVSRQPGTGIPSRVLARPALAVCPVSRQPGTGIPSRVLARGAPPQFFSHCHESQPLR